VCDKSAQAYLLMQRVGTHKHKHLHEYNTHTHEYGTSGCHTIRDCGGNGFRMALTFDDGPTTLTAQLLDDLAAHGVKATFFIVGD
jgi:peptidoglycan/xylan/chitin deacetylase (PgdA/CDA1 family)